MSIVKRSLVKNVSPALTLFPTRRYACHHVVGVFLVHWHLSFSSHQTGTRSTSRYSSRSTDIRRSPSCTPSQTTLSTTCDGCRKRSKRTKEQAWFRCSVFCVVSVSSGFLYAPVFACSWIIVVLTGESPFIAVHGLKGPASQACVVNETHKFGL